MTDKREFKTAAEATSFESFSLINAAILAGAAEARGCTCEAYVDWFTYGRWQALGMQVCKGEHGVKLSVFIPITVEDKETGEKKPAGKRPWHTSVFCRHQVKPKGADDGKAGD